MSRFKPLLAGLGLLCAPLAQADVIGAGIGVEYWNQDPEGWVQEDGNSRVDVDDDLQLDDEWQPAFWAALEHPLPLLPNLKFGYTPMEFSGSGDVSESFTLKDTTFTVSEQIDSHVELNQYDLILYYEVLDNWLNLDLGLNVKMLDGEIRVRGGGRRDEIDFSAPLPLLYANARIDVPATGWNTGIEVSGLDVSGNRFIDAKAHVGYEFDAGPELRVGWRRQQLKLDDVDDVSADFTIDGPYVGLQWDF